MSLLWYVLDRMHVLQITDIFLIRVTGEKDAFNDSHPLLTKNRGYRTGLQTVTQEQSVKEKEVIMDVL